LERKLSVHLGLSGNILYVASKLSQFYLKDDNTMNSNKPIYGAKPTSPPLEVFFPDMQQIGGRNPIVVAISQFRGM
jgi:hypothetical protein